MRHIEREIELTRSNQLKLDPFDTIELYLLMNIGGDFQILNPRRPRTTTSDQQQGTSFAPA